MNIEKIEINGHYVWVDKDAKIKEGDWYLDDCNTARKSVILDTSYWSLRGGYFKIISASPELGLEGVQSYVEWLAEEYAEKWEEIYPELDPEKIAPVDVSKIDFIAGYQTAEKELFTEHYNTLKIKTMTPKEKAKELINKFIPHTKVFHEVLGWEDYLDSAKECALIAVDEILQLGCIEVPYWQQVKQEIEKL